MKNIRVLFIIMLVASFSMISVAQGSAETGGIQWKGYEEGIAKAKAENKKIFLYFHADWCGYCKQMERSTFKNMEVINYLSKNYVTIQVNSDKEKKTADRYGVRGLPTSWFLDADSDKLSSIPGFIDSKRLLTVLKYVNTDSYLSMTFRDFTKSMK